MLAASGGGGSLLLIIGAIGMAKTCKGRSGMPLPNSEQAEREVYPREKLFESQKCPPDEDYFRSGYNQPYNKYPNAQAYLDSHEEIEDALFQDIDEVVIFLTCKVSDSQGAFLINKLNELWDKDDEESDPFELYQRYKNLYYNVAKFLTEEHEFGETILAQLIQFYSTIGERQPFEDFEKALSKHPKLCLFSPLPQVVYERIADYNPDAFNALLTDRETFLSLTRGGFKGKSCALRIFSTTFLEWLDSIKEIYKVDEEFGMCAGLRELFENNPKIILDLLLEKDPEFAKTFLAQYIDDYGSSKVTEGCLVRRDFRVLFIPEKVRSAICSFEERFLSEPYDENILPRHVGYILGHHLVAKTFPTQKTDDSIYATFLSLLNDMRVATLRYKTNPEQQAEQQYKSGEFFPDIEELKAYVVGFRNENRERFDLVVNALNLERLKHFVES